MRHPDNAQVLDTLGTLATALGQARTLAPVWEAADTALQALYGHQLFTILSFNAEARLLQRLYSSRPDINPVGGIKRVTSSPWVDRVLVQGAGYTGSSPADLASVFSDHALLTGHRLGSVLNVSVWSGGVVVGSLNLLDGASHYDTAALAPARVVAQLLAPALTEAALSLDARLPPGVALESV
ncbi:hypothetical protein [Bordetella sp. N]|uniref:hypothetical protein n=1 Tax=Bordetella sp. N TaxID=1746199 RepID=UPI00070FEED5|nr:hypothetical protein [Bordetella sp. N]ALM83079.1 hypothetical protein ASB57_09050 [Bordetella sp. N]